MTFHKRFTFRVLFRILLLLANVVVLAIIFGDTRLFFNQIILAVILIVQVGELIRFVNQTNRELAKFFYAIKHNDFSISFKSSMLGDSFREFDDSLQDIVQSYKQVKIEKEAQYHFLQLLVNQLQVGILVLDKEENITLINPTAEMFINIPGLKNWKLVETKQPTIYNQLRELDSNGRRLLELNLKGEKHFVSVDSRTLLLLDKPVRLITFQDINSEIEQKEIEAWHKLIRILTHEIMNSVTPISSLTETMQGLLQQPDGTTRPAGSLRDETLEDILFSLRTIQKRSDGLLNFIDNYRKLAKVPKPVRESFQLQSFLQSIKNLFQSELDRKQITLVIESDEIDLYADRVLIEQVLINLITNAVHALEGITNPLIKLRTILSNEHIFIEVTDNGNGIAPKELSEIFIPFFSTKKEGSGIGLSLSKQIMSSHNGTIRVRSQLKQGTTFILQFPRV